MTDRDALLAAIIANPDEDVPRTAYADCVQEDGEDDRAEFIRVQCDLAREKQFRQATDKAFTFGHICNDPKCRVCPLVKRERELSRANIGAWTDDLPECLTTAQCPDCFEQVADWETGIVECRKCDSTGVVFTEDRIEFQRGFLHSVDLAAADWLAHADAILAAHPVLEVTLTTMPEIQHETESWRDPQLGNTVFQCRAQWGEKIVSKCLHVQPEYRAQALVAENARVRVEEIAQPLAFLHKAWKRIRKWNLPPRYPNWRNYTAQYTEVSREELIERMRRAMLNTELMLPISMNDSPEQAIAAFNDMVGGDPTS